MQGDKIAWKNVENLAVYQTCGKYYVTVNSDQPDGGQLLIANQEEHERIAGRAMTLVLSQDYWIHIGEHSWMISRNDPF